MVANQRLPKKTKLLYGVGDVGNAVVNSAIQFFLLIFYTDGALIAPALASSALLIGKVWDAVNDPLCGWLSDRTRSRFGKRRVWMIFGALPLAVAIMLLWRVPGGLSDVGTFAWIAGTFLLFDTVWTATNVPYYALTAELTAELRTSLAEVRGELATGLAEVRGELATGRADVRNFLDAARPPEVRGRHATNSHVVSFDDDDEGGDRARGWVDFMVFDASGAATRIGRYHDEYVRGGDGEWRLALREIVFLGGEPELTGPPCP